MCPLNCQICKKINNEFICIECQNNFILYEEKCLESYCFDNFCLNCEIKIFDEGCILCLSCANLNIFQQKILNCSGIINNCKQCVVENDLEFECIGCETNFFLNSSECKKQNSILFIYEYKSNCNEGYLINKFDKCEKISFFCKIGCYFCFEIDQECLKCTDGLVYSKDTNHCKKDFSNFFNFPNEIKEDNFFSFENRECDEVINIITIRNEVNQTFWSPDYEFSVDKKTDFYNRIINCTSNEEECKEIDPNFQKNDFKKCKKKNIKKFNLETKNITNITFLNSEYCENQTKRKNCTDIAIECYNDDCSSFEKRKFCHIHNEINHCKNLIDLEKNNYLSNKIEHENLEICQNKYKNKVQYINSENLSCHRECKIDYFYKDYYQIKSISDDIIIRYDLNKIINYLPEGITIKYKPKEKILLFDLDFNISEFNFIFEPRFIKEAYNCRITKNKVFTLINENFNNYNSITLSLTKIMSTSLFSSFVVVNMVLPNFFPESIFEILQFNEFFAFLYYLDIKGGSYFNYFLPLYTEHNDKDLLFSPKGKKEFQYEFSKNKVKKLVIHSIFDYFLFFNMIFIFLMKFLFKFNKKKIKNHFQKRKRKSVFLIKGLLLKKRNIIVRIFKKIKIFFLKLNYKLILESYYVSVWNLYILYLPHLILLFMKKNFFLEFKYRIFYLIYFWLAILFLTSKFIGDINIIKKYFYLKKMKKISKIKVKLIEDEIYLAKFRFIFLFFCLIKIFVINFNVNQFLALYVIMGIDLINLAYFWIFSKKSIRIISLIKFFPIFFLNIWLFLVIYKKHFWIKINFWLNFFYVAANAAKIVEFLFIFHKTRKVKRMKLLLAVENEFKNRKPRIKRTIVLEKNDNLRTKKKSIFKQ